MRQIKGFTLTELMITVTVLGILMGVGIPATMDMLRGNAVTVAGNQMLGALLLARSEAIKRETNVTFSTVTDGWRVTSGGTELLYHTVDNDDIAIGSAGAAGGGVTFGPTGRSTVAYSTSDFLTVSIATLGANDGGQRVICFSPTGRPWVRSGGSCL